jgi:tetratricopeptide (TPR) repeat protein
MGFRLYKSVNLGGGMRLNLSKTGVGVSAGVPGLRYSVHSSGRRTSSVGIPGSGISYRSQRGGGSPRASTRTGRTQVLPAPAVVTVPKASLFAPKDEKAFVRGITTYMRGDWQGALAAFQESRAYDTEEKHVAEVYFAAFCCVSLERFPEGIQLLEAVLASPVSLPDALMQKYRIGGYAEIAVTPLVMGQVPNTQLAAALMLAELYQGTGQAQRAVELLETLGATASDSVFALSLADLYSELGQPNEALRISEDFNSNDDDVTCMLLVYRADALREQGLHSAALQVLKEALRFKKRNSEILKIARYVRGRTYESLGRVAMARKEWERLYAADPNFADVATKLGISRPAASDSVAAAPPRPDV